MSKIITSVLSFGIIFGAVFWAATAIRTATNELTLSIRALDAQVQQLDVSFQDEIREIRALIDELAEDDHD